MCPDDLDLFCSLVVADVVLEPKTVRWNRLGWDRSECDSYIFTVGTTVEWLPGIGPYIFPRADYERCIQVFKREFETGASYWGAFRSPTVYKSKAHLGFDPDELGAKLEPENGKYYFPRAIDPDGELERQFPVIAVRKEIGDVEVGVFTLRKKALEALSADSITARFLQHGYRVVGAEGIVEQLDAIPLARIPQLRQELQLLRNHAETQADKALLAFIADMEELVESATREGNPISD